jgi:hypothetical protein
LLRTGLQQQNATAWSGSFFEAVDFLFSFRRYPQIQMALNLHPAQDHPDVVFRRAVCFHLQGAQEAARGLLEEVSGTTDPFFRFASLYLRSAAWGVPLDLKAARSLGPGLSCLLELRFATNVAHDTVQSLAEERRIQNLLFEEAFAADPGLFESRWSEWLNYFPEDLVFQLLAALQALSSQSGLDDDLIHGLRQALYLRSELWFLLLCDPLFKPFDPERQLLPYRDGGRLQLWGIHQIDPAEECDYLFDLGEHCPDVYDFEHDPVFQLHDQTGKLRLFDVRTPEPPFRIRMDQAGDRIFGPYIDVIDTIRNLAAHSKDTWFFVKDINTEYIDEFLVQDGRFGLKRWAAPSSELSPDMACSSFEPSVARLLASKEARFQSPAFLNFLQKEGFPA